MNKAVENLPALRTKLASINDNYLDIQQDILATFVDRGQLQYLAQPTYTSSSKRIPGLKLDNPRQLALMHALVRFAQIAVAGTFRTGEIHPHVTAALDRAGERYNLGSLRYDFSKLRAKGLVEKMPRSRRYRFQRTARAGRRPRRARPTPYHVTRDLGMIFLGIVNEQGRGD